MKIFSKLLLIMAMLVSLTPTYVFADKTPAPTRVITLKKETTERLWDTVTP